MPCACIFSASRSFATICSVVNLLAATTNHLHKDSHHGRAVTQEMDQKTGGRTLPNEPPLRM